LRRKGFSPWNLGINKTLRRKRYHLSALMRNAHVVPSLFEALILTDTAADRIRPWRWDRLSL
jgi:hypothetical protein